MPSFMDLPFEIRQLVYSYLLLDVDTALVTKCGPPHHWKWKHVRPMFYTSLFTVNKMLSRESRDFFYIRNSFVMVQGCFQDTIEVVGRQAPIVTLRNPAHQVEALLGRKVVTTINVVNNVTNPKDFEFSCFTFVIAAKHLAVFLTILKYDENWCNLNDSINSFQFNFIFNFGSGEYNYSRNPKITTGILNSIKCLWGLFTLAKSRDVVVYHIDGDVDQAQANDLRREFRYGLSVADILEDLQLLHRLANTQRDIGNHDAALSLYKLIIDRYLGILDDGQLHGSSLALLYEPFGEEFYLFGVDVGMNEGICFHRSRKFWQAEEAFGWAVLLYEHNGLSVPDSGKLYYRYGRAIMNSGYLPTQSLQTAIDVFKKASLHAPDDSPVQVKIQKKIREAERKLNDMAIA